MEHVPEPPLIRLACMSCDREDYDMTTMQKAEDHGWQDIYKASVLSESGWWTHLGYCPECQELVEQEQATLGQ